VALRQGRILVLIPEKEIDEKAQGVGAAQEEGLAVLYGFASTKVIVKGGRPSANHTSCARSLNMLSAAALAATSFVASSVT
jgi:hypothetical protein